MIQRTHHVPNQEGWLLELRQTYLPETLDRGRRPIAIVPGYGMNNFIFGFHPTGPSMEASWAERGFEVWSLNLRAQGGSRCEGGSRRYGFQEAGVTDLTCAFEYVVRHTETGADRVDGVGCSLGGTYLFVYLALVRKNNRLGSVVSMGGPLRWEDPHPALKFVSSSPFLWGQVRFRGTRKMLRLALPALKKVPRFLHLYMHPEIIEISRMDEMLQSVEDPNPVLNRQIAEWIQSKDLYVNGINVTDGLARARNPLLIVLANADGIVPEQTTLSAHHAMASPVKEVLRVGDETLPVAHADLFISEISHAQVFDPLADWLEAQNAPAAGAPAKKKPAVKKKGAAVKKGPARPRKTGKAPAKPS